MAKSTLNPLSSNILQTDRITNGKDEGKRGQWLSSKR